MNWLMTSKYIIILSLIMSITPTSYKPIFHGALAASPAFTRQETIDGFHDSIQVNGMGSTHTRDDYYNGMLDESIDIQRITLVMERF